MKMSKKKIGKELKRYVINFTITILIIVIATAIGLAFRKLRFMETNIVVIFILAVLLTARFTRAYIWGILQSMISLVIFNYFFTEPYYTLVVNDPSYIVTFLIMIITSIITSTLTTKEILLTHQAKEKEMETRSLYTLTNQLSDVATVEDIAKIAADSISSLLQNNCGCLLFLNEKEYCYIQQLNNEQIHRSFSKIDNLKMKLAYLRTEYIEDGELRIWPINGHDKLLGAIIVEGCNEIMLQGTRKKIFHSMLENIAVTIDRIYLNKERMSDREKIVQERYRTNLLRAISHDLRTPLSGIMGTSEMLKDMLVNDKVKYEMIQGIYTDADWLYSLVQNILNLTRLEDGRLVIKKEMEAPEEIIASAVSHIEKAFPDRNIEIDMPEEFYFVPMDARLIEQVFINLLNNAVKHSKEKEKIRVVLKYTNKDAVFSVLDRGEGISEKDKDHIFHMFYTTSGNISDARKGVGLGLTICETIVKAHGGSITGGNRKDGKGSEFIFSLPRG